MPRPTKEYWEKHKEELDEYYRILTLLDNLNNDFAYWLHRNAAIASVKIYDIWRDFLPKDPAVKRAADEALVYALGRVEEIHVSQRIPFYETGNFLTFGDVPDIPTEEEARAAFETFKTRAVESLEYSTRLAEHAFAELSYLDAHAIDFLIRERRSLALHEDKSYDNILTKTLGLVLESIKLGVSENFVRILREDDYGTADHSTDNQQDERASGDTTDQGAEQPTTGDPTDRETSSTSEPEPDMQSSEVGGDAGEPQYVRAEYASNGAAV